MTHDTFTLPVIPQPDPMDPAAIAALTFLGQYLNPNTREAYRRDLQQYFTWCAAQQVNPLAARRMHVQAYAVWLTDHQRNSPKSVQRKIGTVAGYYKTAVLDGFIDHSPAQFVRLPKVHRDPSKLPWLNRWELGAVMHAAKESKQPADWALVTLMGLLGMRVSAACAVQIGDLSVDEAGYRWLHSVGKGGVPSNKVLPIPTWAAIDRARGGRGDGPLLLRRGGSQMTRRSAARVVERLEKAAGLTRIVPPHGYRRTFVSLALRAGVPVHVVQHDVDHARTSTTLDYNMFGQDPAASASNIMAAMIAAT